MPRAKTPEPTTPEPTAPTLEDAIAARYLDPIDAIAPQIASQFWRRLDAAVAGEIVRQMPQSAWEPVILPSGGVVAVLPMGGEE